MTAAPLDPVRGELLRQAHADADEAVARATAEAARELEHARDQAAAILADARARGEADAHRTVRGRVARARRSARATELAARRQIRDAWHSAVSSGVRGLKESPAYPEMLAHLAARARELLGETAVIQEDPHGGVRAHAGKRSVDLTLDAVAERAAARAEGEAARLWTK